MNKSPRITGIEVFMIIAIVAVLAAIIVGPYLKAKAYERVTGKHVSYWDAAFLDLRIQEPVQDQDVDD